MLWSASLSRYARLSCQPCRRENVYDLVVTGAIAILLWRYLNFNEFLPNTYFASVGGARDPKPWYMLDFKDEIRFEAFVELYLGMAAFLLAALLFCRRWLRALGFFGCLFSVCFSPFMSVGKRLDGELAIFISFHCASASPIIKAHRELSGLKRLFVWGLKGRLSNRWRLRLHRSLVLARVSLCSCRFKRLGQEMFKKRPAGLGTRRKCPGGTCLLSVKESSWFRNVCLWRLLMWARPRCNPIY